MYTLSEISRVEMCATDAFNINSSHFAGILRTVVSYQLTFERPKVPGMFWRSTTFGERVRLIADRWL